MQGSWWHSVEIVNNYKTTVCRVSRCSVLSLLRTKDFLHDATGGKGYNGSCTILNGKGNFLNVTTNTYLSKMYCNLSWFLIVIANFIDWDHLYSLQTGSTRHPRANYQYPLLSLDTQMVWTETVERPCVTLQKEKKHCLYAGFEQIGYSEPPMNWLWHKPGISKRYQEQGNRWEKVICAPRVTGCLSTHVTVPSIDIDQRVRSPALMTFLESEQ